MAATFVVTLREGFEAALLLGIVYACLDRFGARQHYRLVTLGVATAAALGWMVFRGGTRLSVRRFFTVTTVALLLVAAGLFSTGLGKLQGLGVLPPTEALWDTSFLLSDHGLVGGFATGLVGYRARPTFVEVVGYAAYLVVACVLCFGGRRVSSAG